MLGASSSEGLQDASPQRQLDTGREWCAIAVPLATTNVANVTQATRRTNLLGMPKSSLFLWVDEKPPLPIINSHFIFIGHPLQQRSLFFQESQPE